MRVISPKSLTASGLNLVSLEDTGEDTIGEGLISIVNKARQMMIRGEEFFNRRRSLGYHNQT